jgi:hypothetical protein
MEKPTIGTDADTRENREALIVVFKGELGGGLVLAPHSGEKLGQRVMAETVEVGRINEAQEVVFTASRLSRLCAALSSLHEFNSSKLGRSRD